MSNVLAQLKSYTLVVADTGEFEVMAQYKPRDATTNPSLILKAVKNEAYRSLFEETVDEGKKQGLGVGDIMDRVGVAFGKKILEIVPGRVSTELDARLSFNTQATIEAARRIIALYDAQGIPAKERVLIKISSTWEGLQACKVLEAEGIHCNMTLLFSVAQAAVAGEVKATLISPFAGRITDYYKKALQVDGFDSKEDPGVESVQRIYFYMKKYGYDTEVMGASFRNIGQIMELAGCDLLTISPTLLSELQDLEQPLEGKLTVEAAKAATCE